MISKIKKIASKHLASTITNIFAVGVFYFACDFFITKSPAAINGAIIMALAVVVSLIVEKK